MEIGVRIEAGQLDRAAVLAADLSEQAERHGFDFWRLYGAINQAGVGGLASFGARRPRPDHARGSHRDHDHVAGTLPTLALNVYITFYDAVLAQLLTAAGKPKQAYHRLDTALAHDTGMCF